MCILKKTIIQITSLKNCNSNLDVNVSKETESNISTKKIEGMGGTLYFINIDVIIKIINISAENEISSLRYASQGVGKSENEAIEKAIQKIKINSEELAEMLSTVE